MMKGYVVECDTPAQHRSVGARQRTGDRAAADRRDTLRVTTVRTADGEVVITPNGQITQVTNLSRDWARAVVDVPVPAAADVNRVSEVLRLIGEEAYQEPELRSLLLDPPAVMGVQSIDVDHFQIRMVARTLPGKQFDVGRMLRVRIAARFRSEGINLPTVLETAEPGRDRMMRRVRTSTWVLTAVFLIALAAWGYFRPPSAAVSPAPAQPAGSSTVAPSTPRPSTPRPSTARPSATPGPTARATPASPAPETSTTHLAGTPPPTASPSPAGTPSR